MKKSPLILLILLLSVFSMSALAQDAKEDFDDTLPTGTHFTSGSTTVDTSSVVTLELLFSGEELEFYVDSGSGIISFTLGGLTPSKTYYLYKNDYHDMTAFTANAQGTYSFSLDVTANPFVWTQTNPSTKFISTPTGGDCSSIGRWPH